MFTVDGIQWDIPCTIERAAKVTSSEISGMLLNKQYFNDVLGTFMEYTIAIAVPFGYEYLYTDIYETLTAPKDGHTFVLPYNEDTITITGRIQVVSDRYVKTQNGNHWRQTRFTVIANHPSKTMDLEDVLSVGLTPLPSVPEAFVGDLYEYTQNGWVKRYYTDGDEEYY